MISQEIALHDQIGVLTNPGAEHHHEWLPPPAKWQEYVRDELSADEEHVLTEHIEACKACEERLAALVTPVRRAQAGSLEASEALGIWSSVCAGFGLPFLRRIRPRRNSGRRLTATKFLASWDRAGWASFIELGKRAWGAPSP